VVPVAESRTVIIYFLARMEIEATRATTAA